MLKFKQTKPEDQQNIDQRIADLSVLIKEWEEEIDVLYYNSRGNQKINEEYKDMVQYLERKAIIDR